MSAAAVLLTGLSVVSAAPTLAAVSPNHFVIVLPDDEQVLIEGLDADEAVTVEVLRNGVVIGRSAGTADAAGLYEVNHAAAPTICWDGHTPDILPGDTVTVAAASGNDSMVVQNLRITEGPTSVDPSTITVKGIADQTPRPALGDLTVDVRSRDPFVFRQSAPGDGVLVYDGPTTGEFTATFSGLTADQHAAMLNAFETVVTQAPAVNEWTTAGDGSSEPLDETCPALQQYAVGDVSPGVVNVANAATDVIVTGSSHSASAVDVTVSGGGGTPVTLPATITGPAAGAQSWSVTFPAASLAGLEGQLTVSGLYTVNGNGITGSNGVLLRDVTAPAAPGAAPPGGLYPAAQSVTLTAGAGETVRYTLDGSVPDVASPVADGPVLVTASSTLRALAVDGAGNPGPVAVHEYVIATPPAAPASFSVASGDLNLTLRWAHPAANGAPITQYVVSSPTAAFATRVVPKGAGLTQAYVLTGLTNGVSYAVRVAAVNAAGTGPAASGTGVPRAVVPSAPPIGVPSRGNGGITARWGTPPSPGTRPITGYRVHAYVGSSTTPARTVLASASARSVFVNGLTNGVGYRIRVQAVSSAGFGILSAGTALVVPSTVPSSPRIAPASSGVAGGLSTATARWLAPLSNGGAAITSYRVYAYRLSSTGAVLGTVISGPVSPSARALTMRLAPGRYGFRVQAANVAGNSVLSSRSAPVTAR